MAQLGMDVEQVEGYGKKLMEECQRIEETLKALGSDLQGLNWQGPDREEELPVLRGAPQRGR